MQHGSSSLPGREGQATMTCGLLTCGCACRGSNCSGGHGLGPCRRRHVQLRNTSLPVQAEHILLLRIVNPLPT
eukprot:14599044-Alexandrium_andersonii.AAC.1